MQSNSPYFDVTQLLLQFSAAGAGGGTCAHPSAGVPVRSARTQWGCRTVLPNGRGACSRGKATMLHVKVVLIPQASPARTWRLRQGYVGKVIEKAGITFI